MAAGPIRGGFRLSTSTSAVNAQGNSQAESRKNVWKTPSAAGLFKPNPYSRPFTPKSAGRLGEGIVDTLTGAVKKVFSFIYTDMTPSVPIAKPEILEPQVSVEPAIAPNVLPLELQPKAVSVKPPQPTLLENNTDTYTYEPKSLTSPTEILSDLILNPKYKLSKMATYQQIACFFEAKADGKLSQYEFDQIAAILRRLTTGPIVVQQHFKYPMSSGMASTVVINDSPVKTVYVNNAVESDVVYSFNPPSEQQFTLHPSRVFTARFDEDMIGSENDSDSLMTTDGGKVFVPIPSEVKLNLRQFSHKGSTVQKDSQKPTEVPSWASQVEVKETKVESKPFAPIDTFKFSTPLIKPITEAELNVSAPKEIKFDFGAANIASVNEVKEPNKPSIAIPDFSTPKAPKGADFKPFEMAPLANKTEGQQSGFTFGVPKTVEQTSEKQVDKTFSFGEIKNADSSGEKPNTAFALGEPMKNDTPSAFSFSAPKISEDTKPVISFFGAPKPTEQSTSAFSFGAPKEGEVKAASFTFPLPTSVAPSTEKTNASGFTFNVPKTEQDDVKATTEPAKNDIFKAASDLPKPFTFGAATEPTAVKPFKFGATATVDETKPFTFGSSIDKPSFFAATLEKPSAQTENAAKTETVKAEGTKPFGSGLSGSEALKPFAFGSTQAQNTEAKATEAKPFTFGSSLAQEVKATDAKPFTFGSTQPQNTEVKTTEAKPFTFGQPSVPAFGGSLKEDSKPATFTFGAKPEEPKLFTFGAPKTEPEQAKPSFSFPQSQTESKPFTFGAPLASVAEEKKPFTFGGSSQTASGFQFGEQKSAKQSAKTFVFGTAQSEPEKAQNTFTFAQPTPSTTSAFTFGSQEASKPAATSPSGFTFGSQETAKPATTGFSFGSQPTPSQPTTQPAFNFGSQPSNSFAAFSQSVNEQPSAKRSAPSNSAGVVSPFSFSAPPATTGPSFTFPAPQSSQDNQQSQMFNFGAAPQPPTQFTFGAPQSQPTQPFVFGQSSDQTSSQSMTFNMGSSTSPALGGRPKTTPVSRRRPYK